MTSNRRGRPPEDEFQADLRAAMRDVANHLDARFTAEISAAKWPWPVPPQVRDIVDTGRLRASQTRQVNESTGEVTFTWPVEYACDVHEGGVGRNGQRFPGRPWTKAPLEEVPRVFAAAMRRRGGGR